MNTLTEGRHNGEGLVSEANFHRSRDAVVIKSGAGKIAPGTILGKITADGKYWPSTDASVTETAGAETAIAVALYGCDATDADASITVISRDAEWNASTLAYHASVGTAPKKAAKVAQLAAVGIIAR